MLAHGEKASVQPSLEVLVHHLQEAYAVTSAADKDGTATITFTHADKHGEVTRTEYPNVPFSRAVELGHTATNYLMRDPQNNQPDIDSGTYTLVITSDGAMMRQLADDSNAPSELARISQLVSVRVIVARPVLTIISSASSLMQPSAETRANSEKASMSQCARQLSANFRYHQRSPVNTPPPTKCVVKLVSCPSMSGDGKYHETKNSAQTR